MFRFVICAISCLLTLSTSAARAAIHVDRSDFVSAVGNSLTDDYTGYGVTASDAPLTFSDAAMSAVFGETRYQSLSFTDGNIVGNVYAHGDGTNYCAGCNGNFLLTFGDTSLSSGTGVFGVGFDIVLHTSRRNALGDDVPGAIVRDGTILIEYGDGTIEPLTIPADIGFFGPEVFFVGVTDSRGIASLTIGTEPLAERHSWVIDNLTVAAAPEMTEVPEPTSVIVWSLMAAAAVPSVRRRLART